MNEIQMRIAEIEAEIRSLPAGYISRKNIDGKIRRYLQWNEEGKKKSKYVDDETAKALSERIERRRELQQELKN